MANPKRLALVFGCSEYANFQSLDNSEKDFTDVKDKLEEFGFKVTSKKNPDLGEMMETLDSFIDDLNAEVSDVVIYFAGHGCQIGKCFI